MDSTRAALRLELSDGELRCPKKGTIGKGRCVQFQEEMACTCAVAVAAGCAIGPIAAPAATPTATATATESPARPVAVTTTATSDRRAELRAAAERVKTRRTAAAPATSTSTSTATPPTPTEEIEMKAGDNKAMFAAMAAEPEREFTREELHALRGGRASLDACGQQLSRAVAKGTIRRAGRGRYQWAGAGDEAPAPRKTAAPAQLTQRPPRQAPRQEPESLDLRKRLLWLAGGREAGYLDDESFVNQVLSAIGWQGS